MNERTEIRVTEGDMGNKRHNKGSQREIWGIKAKEKRHRGR